MLLTLMLVLSAVSVFAATDYPHSGINNIGCDSCHFVYGSQPSLLPPWTVHAPQDIDDTQYNTLCWSCHNDIDAPYVRTHSSLQTDNGYGDWTVECKVCHNPHYQRQFRVYGSQSYLYSGQSTGVTSTTITRAGAGWEENQWAGEIVVGNISKPDYNYKIISNTADTLTVQGPVNLTKVITGNTFAIIYGKLVKESIDRSKITPPKTNVKTARFFRDTGSKSFADGDATYDGICEVCHTETNYHDEIGSGAAHNEGVRCTQCHNHVNGFGHGGGGGTGCDSCHGHDAGWQGNNNLGKGTFKSHSTHTENDSDDLKGPYIVCGDCHDTGSFPNFKSGADINGDGKFNLLETDVCNPCHSPEGTYDGANNNVIGAKANWQEGIYNADGATLQPGKEKWCAGCHDEGSSIIQSVSAPNVIGDEDGVYTYGIGWGFYKTGHGLQDGQVYPSKDGDFPPLMVNGSTRPIGCSSCHDFSSRHIDGVDRTYGTQSITAAGYRQGYRLKMVNGKEPMQIPRPGSSINFDDYLLCFQCHESEPFLDPIDERSNMAQRSTGNANLKVGHYYHLSQIWWQGWKSDWRTTSNSGVSCPQCHNVHGSKNMAMLSDGSLTGTPPGFEFYYYNRALSSKDINGYNPPTPRNMPLRLADGFQWLPLSTNRVGCSATCHGQILYRNFEWTPYNVPNSPPVLSWTGETNYTSDSVYPKSAVSGSNFEFRINYADHLTNMDGGGFYNSPSYIRVMLDNNNDGVFETAYSMDYVSAAPSGGRIYKKIISIRNTYSNTIRYKISAADGPDTVSTGSSPSGLQAVGDPANENTISIINRAPVLSWTNETNYENDGVNPNAGAVGQAFTFRVKYTDPDNQPPDANGVRVIVNGVEYVLDEKAGGYYDTGRIYYKVIALTTAGELSYRFIANDYFGLPATGEPVSDHTVTVQASSTPPTLEWVIEPGRIEGIKPASGVSGDEFEFRIKYTDLNNQWPPLAGYMRIWIDKNDNDNFDNGETYEMLEEVAGSGCVSGKLYKIAVRLVYAGDGILKYRFLASNGVDVASGEPATDKYLTLANSKIWTTDVDFNAGIKTGVSVNGVSEAAYVTLQTGAENWSAVSVTGQSPATSWGPMVYDSHCKKFIYYDGSSYEFNPALKQWTKFTAAGSPPTNASGWGWAGSSLMTYDPDRDRVVMLAYNGQTWEYHEGVWTNRNAQNINYPGYNRFKYAMVYDPTLRKVILIGGTIGPGVSYAYSGPIVVYEETWAYDPVLNSWEPVFFNNTNPPDGKGFSSSKVNQTIAVFDSSANKVIIPYGGGYSYNSSGTFSFGPTDWIWSNLNISTPNRMYQIPLAYDSTKGRAVLYGGAFNDTPQYTTWVFNSTDFTWQQLSPANSPSVAAGSMSYDSNNMKMILNGGSGGTWAFGNTYSLSNEGTISGLKIDAGEGATVQWNTIAWHANVPMGTSIKFQVRTGNSEGELGNAIFTGPDGTDQTYYTISGSPLASVTKTHFIEVKAVLTTTDVSGSPILYSLTVSHDVALQ
ncbi:MAG: hypothetical protein HZC49_07525 [Nitrospirae bacterium]|nr:hypothetical protein [Nitrospirota bacterium]